jgi:DNA-directed RNA polymerase specialized sigma24 family protein
MRVVARMTSTHAQAVIAAYRSGSSLRTIAREFSISPTAVHRLLVRHGVSRRAPGPERKAPDQARDATVIAAYRATRSVHAAGRLLGISSTTVWSTLVRHGEPRQAR